MSAVCKVNSLLLHERSGHSKVESAMVELAELPGTLWLKPGLVEGTMAGATQLALYGVSPSRWASFVYFIPSAVLGECFHCMLRLGQR